MEYKFGLAVVVIRPVVMIQKLKHVCRSQHYELSAASSGRLKGLQVVHIWLENKDTKTQSEET